MKRESVRALVWVSGFLALVGPIATSHAANFVFPLMAAVLVLIPLAFGAGRTRLAAVIVFAVSVTICAINYPAYKRAMERWSETSQ
jgi:hypothetical protein